ncbi:hypothetical protein [Modestobacter versicolor]|uniref:hypothetical protein n=1 Tax=Modestobacter versicolor TaxID=429133 RepID=UPI0034DE897B
MSSGRGWSLGAAVLALASLGLSWAGQVSGAAHPARAAIVVGLLLGWTGYRRRSGRLLAAAAGAGVVGVLSGGLDASPGRVALAGAVVCLVLGCRAAGVPLLPRRTVGPPVS